MEKLTLGPDAFDRPGGLAVALDLLERQKNSLTQVSITLREPGQLGLQATQTLLESLKHIVSLQRLGLGNVDATGSEMGQCLASVLSTCRSTLEELRISSCLVDEECVKYAKGALSRLTSLKVLVFHSCTVWKEAYFGQFLSQMASPKVQLTELCLSSSHLTAASFSLLANTFREHPYIHCLNLSGNNELLSTKTTIHPNRAAAAAVAGGAGGGLVVDSPKLLQQLRTFLWDALATLQHLQSLYLHQCGIDANGALALFRAVENMPRLQRLMMYGSGEGLRLRDSWTHSLAHITGLEELWVGRQVCILSAMERSAMCHNIRRNTSLLLLDAPGYPQEIQDCIQHTMVRNEFLGKAQRTVQHERFPTAALAPLLSCLWSLSSSSSLRQHHHRRPCRLPEGEATAPFWVLRSTVDQWAGSYTCGSTDSAAVVVLAD